MSFGERSLSNTLSSGYEKGPILRKNKNDILFKRTGNFFGILGVNLKILVKIIWVISVVSLVFLSFPKATLGQTTPEVLIKEVFDVAQKGNPLDNPSTMTFLDERFNFSQMAKNILGKDLLGQSSSEVQWFEKSIREIITKTVYPKAPDFLSNVKISYKKTIVDGEKAIVGSSVSKKGEVTDVDYVLTLDKAKNVWRVVDVAIDQESWVQTINEKMSKSYKEKGWKGVKDLLNKRIKELNTKKKK